MSLNTGPPGVMVDQGPGAARPPHSRGIRAGSGSQGLSCCPSWGSWGSGGGPGIRHLPEARPGCEPACGPSLVAATARHGRAEMPLGCSSGRDGAREPQLKAAPSGGGWPWSQAPCHTALSGSPVAMAVVGWGPPGLCALSGP